MHIVSAGGSAGWQVALREVAYKGDVELKGNSALDTVTQVFWSEKAGDTVRYVVFSSTSLSWRNDLLQLASCLLWLCWRHDYVSDCGGVICGH